MHSAKKRLRIEILLHLLFWAGVFYTLTSLNNSHIHVWAKTRHVVSDQYSDTSISSYVYLILIFLAVLFYGNVFWVFRKAIRYKNILVRLAICAGWFLLVFGANYFTVGPLFDNANQAIEPPPMPPAQFKKLGVIKDDSEVRLHRRLDGPDPKRVGVINFMISDWMHLQPILLFAFLVILGISFAYFFLKQWAKSELVQLSTENKFLRSQVNPHFLFNTLNNLFSMAQSKGNDELADGISKLSGMMRYMLYESNEERVPLRQEIEYLQNCIVLNKLRYADEEVKVIFDYPDKIEGIFVAPMVFIPFIENAFKHGVSIGTSSQIKTSISLTDKQLMFYCENANYSFIKKMEMGISGIGLGNVKRRLELVYPAKHSLVINDEDGKFMVKLQIDLS
ncbi:sensor histidine kinase [Mucilaginibacter sp. BJC16-A38]|uniref:sensor histidine kinase n=1 Tax=Mucilaginibacter phenanthrenivorans TaxID=1234842 RepID=UPI0021578442|nr:sensor histidine kinase [Mucilaginibacter phenanthrenivorans]MCR8556385.1 sensor histidine kinase [Mucilaginibacter phenanthrenivorans]